jgi:hypothetical protein
MANLTGRTIFVGKLIYIYIRTILVFVHGWLGTMSIIVYKRDCMSRRT